MMYQWLHRTFPHLPRPAAVSVAALWYAALIALAVIGIFEPQAEFQYLAM